MSLKRYLLLLLAVLLVCSCAVFFGTRTCSPTSDDVKIVFEAYGGESAANSIFPRWRVCAVDSRNELPKAIEQGLPSEMEWSPDGQWIVYSTAYENAYAGGNSEIYIAPADGVQKPVAITNNPEGDISPSWSPDGTRLIYEASRPNDMSGLYILDVTCVLRSEKCTSQPYLFIKQGMWPSWSSDGKQVAYTADSANRGAIFVAYIDAPNDPTKISPEEQSCARPKWSPYGKQIIFVCGDGIYIANDDGTNLQRLSTDGEYPRWSPDERQIAFIAGESLDPKLGNRIGEGGWDTPAPRSTAIFLINSDGSNLRRLTLDDHQLISQFSWLPSVKEISAPK